LSFQKSSLLALLAGLLAGILLIGILAGWNHVATTADVFSPAHLVEALLAGLLLGFLEETIFRGLILRIFYTATRQPLLALNLMAGFFAYTHFKVPTSVWQHITPGVHGDTGFFVAYWTTFGITENFSLAQFVVLWLLGLVLGVLTLRSGSLLPAIGLHTGLVAAMFFYRGSGLTEGWSAAVVLAGILPLVLVFAPKGRPEAKTKT
jgi:membrane protease YdiL (CAAX protease family)